MNLTSFLVYYGVIKKVGNKMKEKEKVLIIIDMQNDFISGSLANKDAEAIVEPLCEYIKTFKGRIICTKDTHDEEYLKSQEGKKLPVEHCIYDSAGWCIDDRILKALRGKKWIAITKKTFGTTEWQQSWIGGSSWAKGNAEILLCGTCTDICVISNALILKALFPETSVTVLSNLCAGLTPELHEAALKVMRSCQVNIANTETDEI